MPAAGVPILQPSRFLKEGEEFPNINYKTQLYMTHRYITVSYDLYADNDAGIHELIEQAPAQFPFQFITNMGMALDSFEAKVGNLEEGEEFDFTLSVDEAYGPYDPDRVIELGKENFLVNGKFAADIIYPGNIIPLVNEDGMRLNGFVSDVKESSVVIDLNDLHAGKDLHYKGKVLTAHEATDAEIKEAINSLTGGGCCSGGCSGCGEDGGCGGHGEEGCCGHHHDEEGGCGHHHGKKGGCCQHKKN